MSKKSEEEPDDVFSAPGFRMERYGRRVHLSVKRSPDEQRELMRRMQESRPQIRADIETKTTELLDLIRKYTSLDLIANLLVLEIMHDPNEYVESDSKFHPHWVEHATVLELTEPQYEVRMPVLVEWPDVKRASALLGEIFEQSAYYYLAEGADPDQSGPPSRIDELRFATLLHGMSVRSPAYSSHWRDVLEGLFAPGNGGSAWLAQTHKLDIRTALSVIDGIEQYVLTARTERFEHARTERRDLLKQLKEYKSTGRYTGRPDAKDTFDHIRNMRGKDAKNYVNYILAEWTRVALGTVLSFDAKQISETSGVPVEIVEVFLTQISTGFGISVRDRLPGPVNVLHETPVVHYLDRYFCSVPHLLPWALKPVFEKLLISGPAWNSYQSHRSSYLVITAVGYLKGLLPSAIAYTGLFYPIDAGGEAELDALLLFDRYALLIEGKAGSLGKARRGGKEKIKSQLEALVGDSADQVVRADTYIRTTNMPVFRLEDGQTVRFDKSIYSERVLMTITLDVLDIYTAEMHQMRDIGVVTTHELPWCVALTDLRAISDILVRSFEFTHYLRWRTSTLSDPHLHGGKDELNWLAVYLSEGPSPLKVPDAATELTFTSYTDKFDAYFLYKEGQRTIAAPRPSQPLPRPIDSVCDQLEADRPFRFTECGELLLDLSFSERSRFAQELSELAFHEKHGQATEFIFEGAAVSIKVSSRSSSQAELDSEAQHLKRVSGKKVLVISVSAVPRWRIFGWSVA